MKIALTIAGSDSCSGAGIQQDLKTFSYLRVYGTSVITAITAQNTKGVHKIYPLSKEIVEEQIDAIFSDIKVNSVKTGLLYNKEIIDLVCKKIKEYKVENLVVDPVMKSTSGEMLLQSDALPQLKKLISLAKITTPNRREAEILSGVEIKNFEDAKIAAKKIGNCVITGSEFHGIDLLHFNGKFKKFKSDLKIKAKLHGAGCAFSAAIAAFLARNFPVEIAVKKTKNFIDEAIAKNFSIGFGLRVIDVANIKLAVTYEEKEKKEVLECVSNAIEKFCDNDRSYKIIPEVGCNIVMALQNAKTINEIAGITGRIVRSYKRAIPVGIVDFSGSEHVARVVLTAMKFNKEKRAAINIKFSDEILEICKKLGFSIGNFERDKEPKNVSTMEWGTREAIEKNGVVPDIIYDEGGKGKEAMIRILAKDANEAVEIAIKIANKL
ncbi:MAG: bifunctional hydroxymethylpyrimidine kinase/phosphomethylpyrimidine kinase [Candidatus Altiarchaeota archaeon]